MKKLRIENMDTFIKQPYKLTMAGTSHTRQQDRIVLRCLQVLQPLIIASQKELLSKTGNPLIIPHQNRDIGVVEEVIKNKKGEVESVKLSMIAKNLILNTKASRKRLRDSLSGLENKTIHFWKRGENGDIESEGFVSFFTSAEIKHKSNIAKIKIDAKAIPYIFDYASYTRINPNISFAISSQNTAVLYKIMSHFRDRGVTHVISFEELKMSLMLDGHYKKPAHFKKRILTPVMEELKKNADVWFDIAERVMDGRKFIGWRFNIYTRDNEAAKNEKKKADEAKNSELASLSQIELSEKKRKALEVLKKIEEQEKENSYENAVERLKSELKLSHWQAEKLAIDAIDSKNEKLREFLKKLIQIVKGGKIRNPGGFVVKQLYAEFGIKLCKSVTKHEHEEQ